MIKRLYYDLEVSPNIGFFWQPGHKVQIDYNSIIDERAIICACWKWEGEKTVYSLTWDRKKNDKQLLKKLVKVLNEADEIVGHNGDKFDKPWLLTRCLYHNIETFPNYTSIDTLKEARKRYKFNSNRLDYIGKFLGLGEKTATTYGLWKDITLYNDAKALRTMVNYCKNDVVLLEKVFKRLKPYINNKVRASEDRGNCPECNSMRLVVNNKRVMAGGRVVLQLKCRDCGKMHSVGENVFNKARTTTQHTRLTNAKD